MQCYACDACQMRIAWESISGAPRSTHEITKGDTARYVAKYLTKDVVSQRYTSKKMHRYSFSRSVRRSPSIVPVYRYIGQTLRDASMWRWGQRNGIDDVRRKDYFTDEDIFLDDYSSFVGGPRGLDDGYWRNKSSCSDRHHGLCDRVPYWSPTKQRAWDYKHWDWFAKAYGVDTHDMLWDKIEHAWNYLLPKLEGLDEHNRHILMGKQ